MSPQKQNGPEWGRVAEGSSVLPEREDGTPRGDAQATTGTLRTLVTLSILVLLCATEERPS